MGIDRLRSGDARCPRSLRGCLRFSFRRSLIGFVFTLFQVPAQHATGDLGTPAERSANFSWLALGYALSGFCGPLIAGFAIDNLGYRWAFALLAIIALVPTAVLASGRPRLPVHEAHTKPAQGGSTLDLLRHPALRRLFIINALFAIGWDLHTIFVPIYGSEDRSLGCADRHDPGGVRRGDIRRPAGDSVDRAPWQRGDDADGSAGLRGSRLSRFPVHHQRRGAGDCCRSSSALRSASGQPIVLSLLHANAPPGRVGETVGMRMSLMQTMAVAVPLVFGVLGSSIGILPVFWSVGVFLGTGGYLRAAASMSYVDARFFSLSAYCLRNFATFGATTNMQYGCAGLFSK